MNLIDKEMTKEQHEQSEIDFKKLKDSGVLSSAREAVVFLEAYELALNIPPVSKSFTEKQMDNAYDKGFKDAMTKYRKD